MRKLRALLQTGAVAGALSLSLGGCPDGTQLTDLAEGLLDLSQDEVVALLDDFIDNDQVRDFDVVDVQNVPDFDPTTFASIEGGFDDVDVSEEEFIAQLGEDPQMRPDDRGDVVLATGRLAGRFRNDNPDSTSDTSPGEFDGRWFGAGGVLRGFVTGRYEPLPQNELPPNFVGGGVFEGHYVDEAGEFRGFLRGTYGRARNGRGRFVGKWYNDDMDLMGSIGGAWDDAEGRNGGAFGGYWAAFDVCEEAGALEDEGNFNNLPGGLPSQPRQPTQADDQAAFDDIEDDLDSVQEADADFEAYFAQVEEEIEDEGFDGELDLLEDTNLCVDGAGLMRGWWLRGFPGDVDPNNVRDADGAWRARWRSASGERTGYVRGLWQGRDRMMSDPNDLADPNEVDDDPRPGVRGYLVGRVFNDDDEMVGTIRGKYGRGPRGLRVFAGRFFDLDDELAGALRGRWGNAPRRPGGPMFGAWLHLSPEEDLDDGDAGDDPIDPNDPVDPNSPPDPNDGGLFGQP